MPHLTALTGGIFDRPDDDDHWLAHTSWLWDNGRDDEAVAVRVFRPVLRDNFEAAVSIGETLLQLTRHAGMLGWRAKQVEVLANLNGATPGYSGGSSRRPRKPRYTINPA